MKNGPTCDVMKNLRNVKQKNAEKHGSPAQLVYFGNHRYVMLCVGDIHPSSMGIAD
jgi:hypothetical protein